MMNIPGTKRIALIRDDGIIENVIVVRSDADINDWIKGRIVRVKETYEGGRGCYYSQNKDKIYHCNNNISLDDIQENTTGNVDLFSVIEILDEFTEYEVFLNENSLGQVDSIDYNNLQIGLNNIKVVFPNGLNFNIEIVKCLEITDALKQQVINELKTLQTVLGSDLQRLKNVYLQNKGIEYRCVLNEITESDLQE